MLPSASFAKSSATHPLLRPMVIGGILMACMDAGDSLASLTCTFGNLAACQGSIGNLSFTNFSTSGPADPNNDTLSIFIDNAGVYNFAANFAPGASNLSGSGNYGFTITANPGYTLAQAGVQSNTGVLDPGTFTFSTSITGATPNPLVSTNGSTATGTVSGAGPYTVLVSWSDGGGPKTAQSSLLQLTTNPPTSVPGPLPICGATAFFVFSRRLRKRINR